MFSGHRATKPTDPTCEWGTWWWKRENSSCRYNQTVVGWYRDRELTIPFDFDTPITEDTTLHAGWVWIAVSAGGSHTVGISELKDGSLWAWGENGDGQLGNGRSFGYDEEQTRPVQVWGGGGEWIAVSAGGISHSRHQRVKRWQPLGMGGEWRRSAWLGRW